VKQKIKKLCALATLRELKKLSLKINLAKTKSHKENKLSPDSYRDIAFVAKANKT
jgi:hypothetical protein